jgi:hypothetical protein
MKLSGQGNHDQPRPYLTLVGWTRNDGYTPNYVERTRHAVSFLLRQLEGHRLPSELVVVEWNPPPDRPLMADLLKLPATLLNVTVRFITVGEKYHRRYRGWRERGLPTVEALNVGIRRARGVFVTPKPLDVFYSNDLVSRLAAGVLDQDCVYRCNRHDVKLQGEGWLTTSDEDLVSRLATAPSHVNERLQQPPLWKIRDLHTNACGDFTLLSNSRWNIIRGYPKDKTVLGLDADSVALHAAVAHGAKEICLGEDCRVYKVVHGNLHAQRTTQIWRPWQERLDRHFVERDNREFAHTLRKWLNYPRRHVRGIDSVLGSSIEQNFVAKAERFARGDISQPTNNANWGWGSVLFPEKVLSRAGWDEEFPAAESSKSSS